MTKKNCTAKNFNEEQIRGKITDQLSFSCVVCLFYSIRRNVLLIEYFTEKNTTLAFKRKRRHLRCHVKSEKKEETIK